MKVQLQWHILMLSSFIFKVHCHTKSMIHTIQGVPKVRSSKFMHHDFWSKLYFYMKLLEDVYFSVEYMHLEFQQLACLFWFFITFCSCCGLKWDTACRPANDPFWAFLSPGAQELIQSPNQYLFSLGSWKK